MKRERKRITRLTAICLTTAALFATGCDANNLSINYVLPLGLAGTPGLLNPFGIVQAFVNAWLGTILPSSSSSSASSSSGSTTAGSPTPSSSNAGVLGVLTNQNGE